MGWSHTMGSILTNKGWMICEKVRYMTNTADELRVRLTCFKCRLVPLSGQLSLTIRSHFSAYRSPTCTKFFFVRGHRILPEPHGAAATPGGFRRQVRQAHQESRSPAVPCLPVYLLLTQGAGGGGSQPSRRRRCRDFSRRRQPASPGLRRRVLRRFPAPSPGGSVWKWRAYKVVRPAGSGSLVERCWTERQTAERMVIKVRQWMPRRELTT